jgi:hypothetical protein
LLPSIAVITDEDSPGVFSRLVILVSLLISLFGA